MTLPAVDAAARFVKRYYADSTAAILGGSAARGQPTPWSDLDIVILDDTRPGPHRKTYHAYGWVIEAFVLTGDTYRYFFDQAVESGIPSLLRMCAEGIVLHGGREAEALADEARADLEAGPPVWSSQELDQARYEIGESLADLQGAANRPEGLFTAAKLLGQLAAFALRTRGAWLGDGKWLIRGLERLDADLAAALIAGAEAYFGEARTEPLQRLTEDWLAPYGGLLSEGYTEGYQAE